MSRQIEQKEFRAVGSRFEVQGPFGLDRCPVAGIQGLAVEPQRTAHDLHPRLASASERVLHPLPGIQHSGPQLDILKDGERAVAAVRQGQSQQTTALFAFREGLLLVGGALQEGLPALKSALKASSFSCSVTTIPRSVVMVKESSRPARWR